MKFLFLNTGEKALVDDEDYEFLMRWTWYLGTDGYALRNANKNEYKDNKRSNIYMHDLVTACPDDMMVAYRTDNRLDNRKDNLFVCSRSIHSFNRKSLPGHSSKYKGVSFHKKNGKWQAGIKINGKSIYLGLFLNESDAAYAYDNAVKKHCGVLSRTNFNHP